MPAIVPLEFLPPTEEEVVKLRVYESNQPDVGFYQIDETTDVGTFPDYITKFTTEQANDAHDWFAIQWEDVHGSLSDISASVQGGVRTLVGEIVERLQLRDPDLDENIIAQNAEATIQYILNVNPYSLLVDDLNFVNRTAISDLVMVAVKMEELIVKSTDPYGYSAGMVSESSPDTRNALELLKMTEQKALKKLGIGGSLIGYMEDLALSGGSFIGGGFIAGGPSQFALSGVKTTFDTSRTLSTTAIITSVLVIRDLT